MNPHIENPDVVLIGGGIMSANLGALLKKILPQLTIQLYELSDQIAEESSSAWHNAGTGHAGICELSYTPNQDANGIVDISKAIDIYQEFELSKQFWAHAVADGMIHNPSDCIKALPHMSFTYGNQQVEFLRARFEGMSKHHFFHPMEFSTAPESIQDWAPLLIAGRKEMPVAATTMRGGTDVNFGALARKLIGWLAKQSGCGVATSHRVDDITKGKSDWKLNITDLQSNTTISNRAKFVFVGAGGGSLRLLQKTEQAEFSGYGSFPIGGQWLVCENPQIVSQHHAKVYGAALDEAPTMAAPHFDRRYIEGKDWLLFGPFAAWTSKFLHTGGSYLDLPGSLTLGNLRHLIGVGIKSSQLVKYMIQQGMQSMESRLKLLKTFYPNAKQEDWKLRDAGIRVQVIKKSGNQSGIVHYGTEIVTSNDKSLAALLGASPGASVSVSIALEVIEKCFPEIINNPTSMNRLQEMIPTYRKDYRRESEAAEFQKLSRTANEKLGLDV